MGIYIPGMDLQKPQLTDGPSVYSGFIILEPDGRAAIVVDNEDGLDSTEYQLVSVPSHGRLIDADALCEVKGVSNVAIGYINKAPTIIPAEEGKP